MGTFSAFDRYRPLLDDWPAFRASLRRPLPVTAWTNTLRTTPVALQRWLRRDGFDPRPLGWCPEAFRLQADVRHGDSLAYLAGWYHVQEEVALLPVQLLAALPGEAVLDLCAAPGNKTAQLAVALRNRGTLIANDRSAGRLNILRTTLARLGLLNVTVTSTDASRFPLSAGPFDRVLADVPCSAEGTVRKYPRVAFHSNLENSRRLARVQQSILSQAVRCCKPGGRIVYATCTFAPEENEAVVAEVLRRFADEDLRLIPTRLPGFRTTPGLTSWEDQAFPPTLRHAHRIWPHQNDTGGFFIAVLQKGETLRDMASAPSTPAPASQPRPVLEVLEDRFGIPAAAFASYRFHPSGKALYCVAGDHPFPDLPRVLQCGLRFVKTGQDYPKLTTEAALAFGHLARHNVVPLDAAQTQTFVNRGDLTLSPSQGSYCTSPGYVMVSYDGQILGIGSYEGEPGRRLSSLFPKQWAGLHGRYAGALTPLEQS